MAEPAKSGWAAFWENLKLQAIGVGLAALVLVLAEQLDPAGNDWLSRNLGWLFLTLVLLVAVLVVAQLGSRRRQRKLDSTRFPALARYADGRAWRRAPQAAPLLRWWDCFPFTEGNPSAVLNAVSGGSKDREFMAFEYEWTEPRALGLALVPRRRTVYVLELRWLLPSLAVEPARLAPQENPFAGGTKPSYLPPAVKLGVPEFDALFHAVGDPGLVREVLSRDARRTLQARGMGLSWRTVGTCLICVSLESLQPLELGRVEEVLTAVADRLDARRAQPSLPGR